MKEIIIKINQNRPYEESNQFYDLMTSQELVKGLSIIIDLSEIDTIYPIHILLLAQFNLYMKRKIEATFQSRLPNSELQKNILRESNLIEFCKSNSIESKEFAAYETGRIIGVCNLSSPNIERYIMALARFFKSNLINKDFISLKVAIQELVWNAEQHSRAEILEPLICTYFNIDKGTLNVSIIDSGIGIPNSVKDYMKNDILSNEETLLWAISENNTVKSTPQNAGKGLYHICNRALNNEGIIQIFSENVILNIKNGKVSTDRNPISNFFGTLVDVTFFIDTLLDWEEMDNFDF